MESIAVTKPDMAVLRTGGAGLSPFGMLSVLFGQEVLRRSRYSTGAYRPAPLELLEEEPAPAVRPAPKVKLDLDLTLIIKALKEEQKKEREQDRRETARAARHILERVLLREREIYSRETARYIIIQPGLTGRTGAADMTGRNMPRDLDRGSPLTGRTGAADTAGRGRGVPPGVFSCAGQRNITVFRMDRMDAVLERRPPSRGLEPVSSCTAAPAAGGWQPRWQQSHPGFVPRGESGDLRQEGAFSILLPDVLRRRRAEFLQEQERPAESLPPVRQAEEALRWRAGTETGHMGATVSRERLAREVSRAVDRALQGQKQRRAGRDRLPEQQQEGRSRGEARSPGRDVPPAGQQLAEQRETDIPHSEKENNRAGGKAASKDVSPALSIEHISRERGEDRKESPAPRGSVARSAERTAEAEGGISPPPLTPAPGLGTELIYREEGTGAAEAARLSPRDTRAAETSRSTEGTLRQKNSGREQDQTLRPFRRGEDGTEEREPARSPGAQDAVPFLDEALTCRGEEVTQSDGERPEEAAETAVPAIQGETPGNSADVSSAAQAVPSREQRQETGLFETLVYQEEAERTSPEYRERASGREGEPPQPGAAGQRKTSGRSTGSTESAEALPAETIERAAEPARPAKSEKGSQRERTESRPAGAETAAPAIQEETPGNSADVFSAAQAVPSREQRQETGLFETLVYQEEAERTSPEYRDRASGREGELPQLGAAGQRKTSGRSTGSTESAEAPPAETIERAAEPAGPAKSEKGSQRERTESRPAGAGTAAPAIQGETPGNLADVSSAAQAVPSREQRQETGLFETLVYQEAERTSPEYRDRASGREGEPPQPGAAGQRKTSGRSAGSTESAEALPAETIERAAEPARPAESEKGSQQELIYRRESGGPTETGVQSPAREERLQAVEQFQSQAAAPAPSGHRNAEEDSRPAPQALPAEGQDSRPDSAVRYELIYQETGSDQGSESVSGGGPYSARRAESEAGDRDGADALLRAVPARPDGRSVPLDRLVYGEPARDSGAPSPEPGIQFPKPETRPGTRENRPAAEAAARRDGITSAREIRTLIGREVRNGAAPPGQTAGQSERTVELSYLSPPAAGGEKQSDERLKALPPWAQRLMEYPDAAAGQRPAITFGQTASPGAAPAGGQQGQPSPAGGRQIQWSAPGGTMTPANISYLETKPAEAVQPGPAPMGERELRRAADKIYRMIEERLRRELRRSGR